LRERAGVAYRLSVNRLGRRALLGDLSDIILRHAWEYITYWTLSAMKRYNASAFYNQQR